MIFHECMNGKSGGARHDIGVAAFSDVMDNGCFGTFVT